MSQEQDLCPERDICKASTLNHFPLVSLLLNTKVCAHLLCEEGQPVAHLDHCALIIK